jgi:hypothetical protein
LDKNEINVRDVCQIRESNEEFRGGIELISVVFYCD